MSTDQITLLRAALASLTQNKTFPADVAYAKRCISDALSLDGPKPPAGWACIEAGLEVA